MTFLFVGITLDVAQILGFIIVFLCYLSGVDPIGWRVSLSIPLMLLGGLGLRLITRKGVMRLSLFLALFGSLVAMLPIGIFLGFFDQQAITFWVFGIDLPNIKWGLEVSFSLCISGLFHHFVLCI